MVMQRVRGAAGILVCLLLLNGCLAAALVGVGAGGALAGYKWLEGNLIRDYPKSLPEMEQAVLKVCQKFRVKVTEKKVSPTVGTISGADPNGEEFTISLEAMPNHITAVGVRVGGFMGNREASELFHNHLAKELGL